MNDLLRLTGNVSLEAAANDKPRRLSISAYDGKPMMVSGLGNVVVDLTGLELPPTVPVLAQHENTLAAIVGQGKPSVVNGKLVLAVTLAPGDAALRVIELLQAGIGLEASIGAETIQRRYLQATQEATVNGAKIVAPVGGLTIVEKSRLRETSILPVGANLGTAVVLASKGVSKMSDSVNDPIQAAIATERDRIRKIEATLKNLPPTLQTAVSAAKDSCVSGEIGFEEFQAACLEAIRADRPAAPMVFGRASFAPTANHLSTALMVRAGFSAEAEKQFGANVMEQSKHLHGASLVDMCKAALLIDGKTPPTHRGEMIRAAVSSGSLPIALGSSMDKVLAAAYRTAPAAWRQFAAVKSAANFRTHTSLRPSFLGDLQPVAPGGELKHGSFQEETYTWSVATYAKMLSIDRTQIFNDDLSAFDQVVPAFGRAAARTLSGLVATTILANAGSFWSSGNLNYFSGASTNLQASSLATAIQYLRQMKDLAGNILDLQPAVLLVCPELEHVAKALVTSGTMQRYVASGTDQAPMGNPFENVAQVVVEPRLSDSGYTGYSTTAWWLFSAPQNEAVVVGFLDGLEAPTAEYFGMDSDPDTLAVTFRIYHDFGCSLGDYRASVMSKGAA